MYNFRWFPVNWKSFDDQFLLAHFVGSLSIFHEQSIKSEFDKSQKLNTNENETKIEKK